MNNKIIINAQQQQQKNVYYNLLYLVNDIEICIECYPSKGDVFKWVEMEENK